MAKKSILLNQPTIIYPKDQILSFIQNKDLYDLTYKLLVSTLSRVNKAEADYHSNVVDPFSAVFDVLLQEISLETWTKQEIMRQCQKNLSNYIGKFHQDILGSIDGWESLPTGSVVDLQNRGKQIIAEVKNKYNTTKGNHKKDIYDDLNSLLTREEYNNFIGYYVEVIPERKRIYNKVFTPSDNVTKTRREPNENIRIIDGKSFYTLATGIPNAIEMLFDALPIVIRDLFKQILNRDNLADVSDAELKALFVRVYQSDE